MPFQIQGWYDGPFFASMTQVEKKAQKKRRQIVLPAALLCMVEMRRVELLSVNAAP